ncbi:MAG: hypothetical protein V1663_03140 [archaeon]
MTENNISSIKKKGGNFKSYEYDIVTTIIGLTFLLGIGTFVIGYPIYRGLHQQHIRENLAQNSYYVNPHDDMFYADRLRNEDVNSDGKYETTLTTGKYTPTGLEKLIYNGLEFVPFKVDSASKEIRYLK